MARLVWAMQRSILRLAGAYGIGQLTTPTVLLPPRCVDQVGNVENLMLDWRILLRIEYVQETICLSFAQRMQKRPI